MPVFFYPDNGIGVCIFSLCVNVFCLFVCLSVCHCFPFVCSVIVFTILVPCRRFRYPLLHVFTLSFPCCVLTVFSKCHCSVPSVLFFLFLFSFFAFLMFSFICVLGPFLDLLLLACPRSAPDPQDNSARFADHTGNSHPSQGCFSGEVIGTSARLHRAAPLPKGMLSQRSNVTTTPYIDIADGGPMFCTDERPTDNDLLQHLPKR